MRIQVEVDLTDARFALDDLASDLPFADLVALLELETDIPRADLDIFVNHRRLDIGALSGQTLAQAGISDGTKISLLNSKISEGAISPGPLRELRHMRGQYRSNPYQMSLFKQVRRAAWLILQDSPQFADAILHADISLFAQTVVRLRHDTKFHEDERRRHVAALEADPFNVEAQRALEVRGVGRAHGCRRRLLIRTSRRRGRRRWSTCPKASGR